MSPPITTIMYTKVCSTIAQQVNIMERISDELNTI